MWVTSTFSWNFDRQLKAGNECEGRLDAIFSPWYHIKVIPGEQQRAIGYDRLYTDKETGRVFRVEHKCDWKTKTTGNVFIETVSKDTSGKPGWVYASKADILIYWPVGMGFICIASMKRVREKFLKDWLTQYHLASAQNETYTTKGILVPLDEFTSVCNLHEVEE